MGRKRQYDREAIIEEVCRRLSKGEPMAAMCRDEHMPGVSTIHEWMEDNPDIAGRVAQARNEGFDYMAADCLNIADDNGKDTRITDQGVPMVDRDHIQRSKLRIETRLKLLACWDPKRYGNKMDLTSGGNSIPAPIIQLAHAKPEKDRP